MSFPLRFFGLALLLATTPFAASADVLYNLTLTSTQGYAGGTGSFAINQAPPAVGTYTYVVANAPPTNGPGTPGDVLTAFFAQVSVGPVGAGFSLADIGQPDYPFVRFTDGVPTQFSGLGISGGQISYGIYSFGVGATTYDYSFFRYTGGSCPMIYDDSGTVTITPAITSTPEPSSIALLGTGLLGLGAAVRRRSRAGAR